MATLEDLKRERLRRLIETNQQAGGTPPPDAAPKPQTITEGQVVDFGDGPVQMRQGKLVVISPEEAAAIAAPPQPSVSDVTTQTMESLGFDPTLERGTILPIATDPATGKGEFAAPELVVDVLRGFLAPGSIFKGGDPKVSDVLQFLETAAPGALRGGRSVAKTVGTIPGSIKPGMATEPIVPTPRQPSAIKRALGVPGEAPLNVEQAARSKRFDDLGIVSTKGDITQDFAQQATEQRLLGRITSEAAEPLRQKKLVQSNQFKARVETLVKGLGVTERAGEAVKKALTGEKKLLTKEKNKLYAVVAKAAPEVADTPLFTNSIEDAVPDATLLRRIRRLSPNTIGAVDDLLVEFGIDKSDEAVEAFLKSGAEITPLALRNFEDFRAALNQIERADQTGATSVITGPIKRALDEEAGFIDAAIREQEITDVSIVETLKEARKRVVQLKQEFSAESITGRLIKNKRDGVTPVVETSKVADELLKPNVAIEKLQRTLKILNRSTEGKQAIGDLRATVVLKALDDSLAASRKTDGIQTISGTQFSNSLDKFGGAKLKLLFKGDKESLRAIKELKQIAKEISPPARAVPVGSATVNLDIAETLGRFARLPIVGPVVQIAKMGLTANADDRIVQDALKSLPEKSRQFIIDSAKQYPNIAARLGLITATTEEK